MMPLKHAIAFIYTDFLFFPSCYFYFIFSVCCSLAFYTWLVKHWLVFFVLVHRNCVFTLVFQGCSSQPFHYSVLLCFKVDANSVSAGAGNFFPPPPSSLDHSCDCHWVLETVGLPCGPWFLTNSCGQSTVIASKISKVAMPNLPLPV